MHRRPKGKHAKPKEKKKRTCTAPGCMGAGVIHLRKRDGSYETKTCDVCNGKGEV